MPETFLLKTITALTTRNFHFINIALIDRENLAGLWTARSVNEAAPLFCQHGARKQKIAAGAALTADALADR
jgi:hypothetical protein